MTPLTYLQVPDGSRGNMNLHARQLTSGFWGWTVVRALLGQSPRLGHGSSILLDACPSSALDEDLHKACVIESTEHVREPQVSFKSFGVIIETQTSVRIVPWHRIHSVDYPQQPSSAPAG